MKELRPEGVTYRVEAAVGQGLSSTVYKALREDSQGFSQQRVALKILRSKTAVSWLRREFQTLERVRSPHCVKVLAWENLPEGPALVLEWIEGLSLLELARLRVLDETIIREILAQVQEGLRAVGGEGLHHGDLSPGNILIDRTGLVRIVDFGLDPDDVSGVHGTPAYMAPELWEGQRTSLAGDLFALGLIELDLKNSWTGLPNTQFEARARSFGVVQEEDLWLHPIPSHRGFKSLDASERARDRLAKLVRECLDHRDRLASTMRLQPPPTDHAVSEVAVDGHQTPRPVWLFRRLPQTAVSLGVLICGLTLPGLADAPAVHERSEPRAELQIRSLHWLRISINGVEAGYSPLTLKGLRAGQHRLAWVSANQKGEITLTVRPGERILLKEGDLARLQMAGKD